MTFVPRPAQPGEIEQAAQARLWTGYHWGERADGQWWLMREGPADEDPAESFAAATRIRRAAQNWAKRNNLRAESMRREHGRRIWIRITKREDA